MIYLVDASVYVFRAWFSIPDDMIDLEQNPVNAVYGYARFLGDFLERTKAEYVAAAFDVSLESSFRTEIYPDYKANREPAPPELKLQFKLCREVTRALGVAEFADPHYEADDLIGTLCERMRAEGANSTIVSRDKDLLQLLRDGDAMWDFAGGKRVRYHQVPETLGVRAEQVPDFLALAGDSVDNIPGIPGVGAKTASALLSHFDTLDEVLENTETVETLPIRGAKKLAQRLRDHRESAEISRQLTGIHCQVPSALEGAGLTRRAPDLPALEALYDRLDFGEALRRQARRIGEAHPAA